MLSRFEMFSSSISCIYHHVQKIERNEMARYGLKGPHAQCLLAMNRYPGGITASKLCSVCDKDKAAISRTIAELENEGLVFRDCTNGNRYRALLKLTEQGKAAAIRVNIRATMAVEQAGKGLTEDQRKFFYIILDRIADNLQTMSSEGLPEK